LIPLATTTVTVRRVDSDPDRDPYDTQPAATVVASGVRATISTGRGQEDRAGSDRTIVQFRMSCDPFDGGLLHTDTVEDERSGEVYEVKWAVARDALEMPHFQAGMDQISGVVSRPLVGGF
jgi:hypothetical protein